MIKLLLFLVVTAIACTGCESAKKERGERKMAARTAPELREESGESISGVWGRLKKAVAARDMTTLAQMMTTDFGYSLNPERSGEGVFRYWDENNLWVELEGILTEKFVKKGDG